MTLEELKKLMGSRENEHLEFKEAKSSFSVLGNSGKNRKCVLGYCVGLGNKRGGKLILGITEKFPRKIVGSLAIQNPEEVKSQIYRNLGVSIEIEELFDTNSKRIVIIYIPSRKIGTRLKFYGIPLMRIGEELLEMDDVTENKILNEIKPDWSAMICRNATIDDLDSKAISVARKNYKTKNPKLAQEIEKWNDKTFLNKSKLTIKGKVTNTAILLLGKEESGSLISPAISQITWILKGKDGIEKDYEHFFCPLLLSVEDLYKKIRNLKYRYIKDESLFPEEVNMYAPYVIRESLHNCIAHQDYSLCGRIQVIENEEGCLLFTNKGRFIPESIENVIKTDSPQECYRNKFLANAMVNLDMIDTIGSGIKRMFTVQKEKFFPLPSYDFLDEKVSVTIYGKILDLNYAKVLAHHKDLTLLEIMLLDQVQKHKHIPKIGAKQLKEKNLIEGRYPNLYISEQVAGTTGEMAQYIKNRPFHKEHYKKLVKDYIMKYRSASRQNIDELLMSVLPDILDDKQKKKKISNLLYDLSKNDKVIINIGTDKNSQWEINN
ncbi:transcriptional regulator [bacterium]|nr:MAG: transcriptional regulator [bacterium]